ncbi:MAG: hypothetical protein GWO20_06790 [Candidatus Korarchaeota archaeon]|nr:hypothetical protein [Candidatus Korarchaeota archaeon]NIU83574.1 hypothetical protein [Candidatus Thorarchaeota archaeon]NIW13522.1 hypothetical protein [Candidatus Thorarchaeota archaeon]NIW53664.1 hypothetical protein [Candidatus Korarchaeota archaeon]
MSYEEAKKQVTQCPTGVFIPNVTPLSSKEKIRNLMACPNCVHGKVDKWIDFEEFVSYIIT